MPVARMTLSKLADVLTGLVRCLAVLRTAPAECLADTDRSDCRRRSNDDLTVTGLTTGRFRMSAPRTRSSMIPNFCGRDERPLEHRYDRLDVMRSILRTLRTYPVAARSVARAWSALSLRQQVQSATGSGLSIVDTLVSVDTVSSSDLAGRRSSTFTPEAARECLNPFRPCLKSGQRYPCSRGICRFL